MLRGSFRADALTGERFFRWRGGEVSRLEGLADAVFALALTLLVVRLDVPQSFAEVKYALWHAPVYLVCFALFVWIWFCHHQFHRRYGLETPWAVTLDAAILFVVLLFALPLRFVAQLIFAQILHGGSVAQREVDGSPRLGPDGEVLAMFQAADGPLLMSFYAGGFGLVFLLLLIQTYSAYRAADALHLDAVERLVTRNTMRAHALSSSVGVLVLLLILLGGPAARYASLIFFIMGPAHGILGYLQGRAVHALALEEGLVKPPAPAGGPRA